MVSFKTIHIAAVQVAIVAAAALHEPRSILSNKNIYAYGKHINGFLVYADSQGLATIASSDVANANGYSNLTWSMDSKGSVPWNVTATSAGSSVTGSFYIDPSYYAYSQAGFSFNGTVPDEDDTTTGFVLYGSGVMYDKGGSYLSKFWAHESDDGSWSLRWNGNGSSRNGSVPVVLKSLAP